MAAEEVLLPGRIRRPRRCAGSRVLAGRNRRSTSPATIALLGRTYAEIGTEARSMHKCQGTAQLLSLPGPSTTTLAARRIDARRRIARGRAESLFDGVDYSIAGLAQFAGARPPRELTDGLAAIAAAVQDAQKRFDADARRRRRCAAAAARRAARRRASCARSCATMPIDDDGTFEIEFRLRQKEREFQQAILLANGVRIDALADDGVVVPGQPVRVVHRGRQSRRDADVTVKPGRRSRGSTATPPAR